MTTTTEPAKALTADDMRDAAQVKRANASDKPPAVFIHGLWLLPSSWDRWAAVFDEAGYSALAPGWPDDPETVAEANADPEVFAGNSVGDVADHLDAVVRTLDRKPVNRRPLVRRAADPDPGRSRAGGGVGRDRSGPIPGRPAAADLGAAVRVAGPDQPGQLQPGGAADLRAVPVRLRQRGRRGRGASAVRDVRGPGAGQALFQAASANLNPWTEVKVDRTNPERGPLLIISGEKDNTVPRSISNAFYKRRKRNAGVTEFVEMAGRGHALVIDGGWREVADTALAFVKRFT